MSHDFVMPSLGADMEDGTLVEWTKRPGEAIARGDVLCVVETQKGAIEVECFQEGRLEAHLVEPGTLVPVGAPIARLSGGAVEEDRARQPPAAAPRPTTAAAEPLPPPPSIARIGERPRASPAARKLAAERGVELAGLKGSGPAGAVLYKDVLASSAKEKPSPPKGLDLQEMRKAIAAAMARSKREIPHYYLAQDIDIGQAEAWIEARNAHLAPEDRLLLGALFVRATALALKRHPALNGFWREGCFEPSAEVHLGVAVSIRGGGLVAPAIREADSLTLPETMRRLRDLVARARRGSLRSSELTDATATMSSLGERGVDCLYGIIYPPQVALVGFGRVSERPWAVEGALRPARVVTATLAADHRASDGHAGGLLIAEIAKLLRTPEAL
jgi:pyruvate dehydrogenase E2 component (dihydrolipoamide acetyltransferase)